MLPRTLTLSCALVVIGTLAAVLAVASPPASREDLVIRETPDGLLLKLSKRRGVAVLIVDGNRVGVRRRAPYTFFLSDAMLRNTGGLRHRIAIRDGKSGKLLALRYIRRQFPADCSVDPATMTAPGCTLLRDDTAAVADPEAGLWGEIEAVSDSRHQEMTSGGDPRPKANGVSQGNTAFRRLTVQDGDDFYGERVELGNNEYRYGENSGSQTSGTFALYREGERKITFFSQRYGAGFTSSASGWQTIMQMKQAQPYAGNGPVNGAPALELQLHGGRVRLHSFWSEKWSSAAPPNGRWIRYALDVTYSQDPTKGKVQVFVDSNADGDLLDKREMSPVLTMRTLADVTAQGSGSIPVGGSIPGHLRLGLYHHSVYGTSTVDVDNVQVVDRIDRRE